MVYILLKKWDNIRKSRDGKKIEIKIRLLKEKCNVIICGSKQVNLKLALDKLYSLGIKSILLEGGSTLNFSMFKEKLIDEVSICIGSKILGGYDSKTFVDGEGFDKIKYKSKKEHGV